MIYGLTYQQVFPLISGIANFGNVVMPDLWNVSAFLFILLFALIVAAAVLPDRPGGVEAKRKRRVISDQ